MTKLKRIALVTLLALPAAVSAVAQSQPVSTPSPSVTEKTASVKVGGDKQWVDTGMDVAAGDKLHITATGTVDFSDKKSVTPAGLPREWKDTLRDYMVPSAGRGALVGQVGNDRAVTPF